MKRHIAAGVVCLGALLSSACGDSKRPAVNSTADAERAYLGLDGSIDRAVALGFDGFNAASSANIAPRTANGDDAGTLTVTGQVDHGACPRSTAGNDAQHRHGPSPEPTPATST